MKGNWIRFKDFLNITRITQKQARNMIASGQVSTKYLQDTLYSISDTNALIKTTQTSLVQKSLDADFVKYRHDIKSTKKVVEAKDEMILAIKNKKPFLKDSLISTKEAQIDDKKTIENLRLELEQKAYVGQK